MYGVTIPDLAQVFSQRLADQLGAVGDGLVQVFKRGAVKPRITVIIDMIHPVLGLIDARKVGAALHRGLP